MIEQFLHSDFSILQLELQSLPGMPMYGSHQLELATVLSNRIMEVPESMQDLVAFLMNSVTLSIGYRLIVPTFALEHYCFRGHL